MNKQISLWLLALFLTIITLTLLTIINMKMQYGCVNVKYQLIKEYNISDYSCEKLRDALNTNTFLYKSEFNYYCKNIDNFNYYDGYEMKDEYGRRCLNGN